MNGTPVVLTQNAKKDLRKVPIHIVEKFQEWVGAVESEGIAYVRKCPGYHDEPLKGKRQGQRSLRLSRSYRAIYELKKDGRIEFISVEEVNKHEY